MKNSSPFYQKSVAILAPGPSLLNQTIDKNDYDLIVCAGNWFKMGRQFKQVCQKDPDFIYLNPGDIKRLEWYPIKNITIPPIRKQEDYSFSFEPWCDYLGCNINTGFAAILDVYLSNPKSIYLQGFTFYQSEIPYFQGYTSKFDTRLIKATKGNLSGHNQEIQFDFFKKYIYPYIEVDSALKSIMS